MKPGLTLKMPGLSALEHGGIREQRGGRKRLMSSERYGALVLLQVCWVLYITYELFSQLLLRLMSHGPHQALKKHSIPHVCALN